MAKYGIVYSCGHAGEVELYGKEEERRRKIKWYEDEGVCPECYKAQREEAERKQVEEANSYGLADLTGSEKQVAWANKIRAQFVNAAMEKTSQENKDWLLQLINKKTEAKFWIDNRDCTMLSLGKKIIGEIREEKKEI